MPACTDGESSHPGLGFDFDDGEASMHEMFDEPFEEDYDDDPPDLPVGLLSIPLRDQHPALVADPSLRMTTVRMGATISRRDS